MIRLLKVMERVSQARVLALLGLLWAPVAVSAMSAQGLQFPVWLERDGDRVALALGQEIEPGAQVVTGDGGKVWLRMDDGALVKLGESAQLAVKAIRVRPAPAVPSASSQSGSFIEAALDVLEGAFRYTTSAIENNWRRDVQLGLGGTATVGIRGTDLWGQVGPQQQFVVLLEGRIEVTPTDGSAVTLDTPLQIYQAVENAVGDVTMDQVAALAPETELDFGSGVQSEDGAFQLNLASFDQQSAAERALRRARAAGLSTELQSAQVEGRTWYRLVVLHMASLADARALKTRLTQEMGFSSPWVSNQ